MLRISIIPLVSTLLFVCSRFPLAVRGWHNITYNSNDTALIYQPLDTWGNLSQITCPDWPFAEKAYDQGTITLYFEGVGIYLYSLFMNSTNPVYTIRVDEDEPVRMGFETPNSTMQCDPVFLKTEMVYAKHRLIFNITNEPPYDVQDVRFLGMIVTIPDQQDGIPFNSTEQFSNATSTATGITPTTTSNVDDNTGSSFGPWAIGPIIGIIFWSTVIYCCCCKKRKSRVSRSPSPAKEDTILVLIQQRRIMEMKMKLNTVNTNTDRNSVVSPPPYAPPVTQHPEVHSPVNQPPSSPLDSNKPVPPLPSFLDPNNAIYPPAINDGSHPLNPSLVVYMENGGNPMRNSGNLTENPLANPINGNYGTNKLRKPMRA